MRSITRHGLMQLVAQTVLALALVVPAGAQEIRPDQPSCTAPAGSLPTAQLPAHLSGWTSKTELASALDAVSLDRAALSPGKAANVALHHTREVKYVTQPEKPGGSVAYGGL